MKEVNSKEKWVELGKIHYKKEKYKKAITAFNKALEIDSLFADAIFNLGRVFYKQKKFDHAIKYFKRTLSIEPECAKAYLGLGDSQGKLKNYESSIKNYILGLNRDDKNKRGWRALGSVYMGLNALDKAINAFNKALELDEKYIRATYNLGDAYYKKKNYKKTKMCYVKLVNEEKIDEIVTPKEKSLIWSRLGIIYYSEDNISNAEDCLNISLEYDSKNQSIRHLLNRLKREPIVKEYEKSLLSFKALVDCNELELSLFLSKINKSNFKLLTYVKMISALLLNPFYILAVMSAFIPPDYTEIGLFLFAGYIGFIICFLLFFFTRKKLRKFDYTKSFYRKQVKNLHYLRNQFNLIMKNSTLKEILPNKSYSSRIMKEFDILSKRIDNFSMQFKSYRQIIKKIVGLSFLTTILSLIWNSFPDFVVNFSIEITPINITYTFSFIMLIVTTINMLMVDRRLKKLERQHVILGILYDHLRVDIIYITSELKRIEFGYEEEKNLEDFLKNRKERQIKEKPKS